MADDWVNPDSTNDPDIKWFNDDNAKDGDTGTYAEAYFADYPLELILDSAINCDKIRLFAHDDYVGIITDPDVTIGIWYDGDESYTELFTGTITKDTWVEKPLGEIKSVLKVQVEAEYLAPTHFISLGAVQFNQVAAASADLTGTVTTATETDIVAGDKTIILTLTGDTWVAAGATFEAQRQNIINGMDSAQSEGTGWDAVVKTGQGVADVIRTSNTVVTITLDAFAAYDITAAETITATIPGSALTGGILIVATPTFQVTLAGAEGWLSGWTKRVKLTIDNTDVDVAVSNFPILVYLSTSSGRNSDDVSFIFDELTSDDNRKKIAVTTDDGETECYVEIEKWDDANEKAWLWVKVPSVASGADTDLYLYYDSSHADNDTYIGDPSDAVVHNVWDANFKFVSHMRDDPDTSHIRDSTVNALDGTKKGAGEPAITTGGMINDAQHFDNVDDYIDLGTSLSPVENFTVEIWGKIDALATDKQLVSKGYDGTNTQWEIKTTAADGKVSFRCWTGSAQGIESTNKLVADEWTYLVGIYSTTTWYLHWNGAPHVNSVDTGPIATAQKLEIGAVDADGTPSQFWDGVLCELRISDMVRTDAWIKATYETGRDDLLDFGEEETSTSIKTICGVAIAAIKTVSGVAIADVKSVLGVSNVD